MKRLYDVEVRGKEHTWGFPVKAKPEHAQDWRNDGLIVSEIVNRIPEWAVRIGLTRIWCRVQDVWNAIRLF